MLESELEQRCNNIAESFGWIHLKGSSRNGAADRFYIRCGVVFCVEFKTKHRQTNNQKAEQQRMEENGTPYFLVRSVEEFATALRRMNKVCAI